MFVNRARGAQRNRLKLSDSLRKGKKFQDAIQEIEKNSCVRFRTRKNENDYINIIKDVNFN